MQMRRKRADHGVSWGFPAIEPGVIRRPQRVTEGGGGWRRERVAEA